MYLSALPIKNHLYCFQIQICWHCTAQNRFQCWTDPRQLPNQFPTGFCLYKNSSLWGILLYSKSATFNPTFSERKLYHYTVKKVSGFPRPVPSLPVPARESLASDIPAGDEKTANLFLQCSPLLCFQKGFDAHKKKILQ
jgi:hypothetical protein